MAKQRRINIEFPLAGLNRRAGYRQQPPYSSPDMLNVRPFDAIAGRERGGSRPGLVESHMDDVGGEVRLLKSMTLAPGDGFTAWSDPFDGSTLASVWSQATWVESLPSVLDRSSVSVDTSVDEGAIVREVLPIDTSKPYSVEAFLIPWAGRWPGTFRIYLRLDDTTPDIEIGGVVVELTMTGEGGEYSASLVSVDTGVESEIDTSTGDVGAVRPGWLSVLVDEDGVSVYWCGLNILSGEVDSHAGTRIGLGLECTEEGGACVASTFRVQYYSTGSVPQNRSVLVASSEGDLFYESTYGRMAEVTTDLTLADSPLTAAQSGQDLYIADYSSARATGTDGTVSGTSLDAASVADWTALGIRPKDDVVVVSNAGGATVAGTYKIVSVAAGAVTLAIAPGDGTCAYRIERAPKVYRPLSGAVEIMTAEAGQVPSGCPLICRHLDRLFLAGGEIAPHVWYCSRQGNPLDWDYSQDDSRRAVAGPASEAGVPGSPITALIPHSDDYLIVACLNSLWRLRGDPAYGGSLDALSQAVGVIGMSAWCKGPGGEIVFLSLDGLYILPPGGESFPVSMSREVLPRELQQINSQTSSVSLEYDVEARGVHVFVTPDSANAGMHWWFDWDGKRFWPVSLNAYHEPTAACFHPGCGAGEAGVVLGGRDGVLRRFSDYAENDCGIDFDSEVTIGPIALASDSEVGTVLSIDAVVAAGSGPVAWSIRPSMTFEGCVSASASSSGTWTEGLNATVRPACRGQAFVLKLAGTGRRWAMEQIVAITSAAGRRRLP